MKFLYSAKYRREVIIEKPVERVCKLVHVKRIADPKMELPKDAILSQISTLR